GYLVHPALLDACLQVISGALPTSTHQAWLPVKVGRYRLLQTDTPITQLSVQVTTHPSSSDRGMHVNVLAFAFAFARACEFSTRDTCVLRVDDLQLRRIEGMGPRTKRSTEVITSGAAVPANTALEEVGGMPGEKRQSQLLEQIRARVAQILDSKVSDVPVDRPLDTLGLDSLMAFELREEIKQSLGVEISLEVFLQDATLVHLSHLLTDKLASAGDGDKQAASPDGLSTSTSRTSDEGLIEGAI
ncbi:MAG: acyl carrier protein, partial [Pirellulaceae bacterium]